MDAFAVHQRLIDDYRSFTEGFVDIRDRRLAARFEELSLGGRQWPDPWLSLNPSFASGGRVSDGVAEGLLHPSAAEVFAVSKGSQSGAPLSLYRHQRDAIEIAARGRSYVLTTGTGSGKSLSYIVPIVDRILREGSGKGIRAIVVYPMNALANSQMEELNKFLQAGLDKPLVTYRRYTGQEQDDARREVHDNPPDILLTNYVMLELMLTRPEERRLLAQHAQALDFLVLDELHTYRGRQGADVALLVRRVREITGRGQHLQCVGTSATMSSGGDTDKQKMDVAQVASRVFGTTVDTRDIVTETLVQATTVRFPDPRRLAEAVRRRGQAEQNTRLTYGELTDDHLASWIEDTFGIEHEQGTQRLVRRPPTTVVRAAAALQDLTGVDATTCANAIRATLLAGSAAKHPETGKSFFAFRLHQFLSKSAALFVTAETPEHRRIETDYQVVTDHDHSDKRLYPLAFCRECGQEYLVVRAVPQGGGGVFQARSNTRPADDRDGYLFISTEREWPVDPIAEGRLPSSWLTTSGTTKLRSERTGYAPVRLHVAPDGSYRTRPDELPGGGTVAAWIPHTFRFCLHCGITYEARTSELAKLATLDREGRSSAMSIVASSIVQGLRDPAIGVVEEARKLLTFVDNRQDAALQSGHFNDFVQVVQLRAALRKAVEDAGSDGLDPLDLGPAVTQAMGLHVSDYALTAEILNDRPIRRALLGVVEYRALCDLQKGLRVTVPNLEQTGLLRVTYPDVETLVSQEDRWDNAHPRLQTLLPDERAEIITVLLDEMRRVLAIDAEALTPDHLDRLRRSSREHLSSVLAIGEGEPDPVLGLARTEAGTAGHARSVLSLSGRSAFGRWLRTRPALKDLTTHDATDVAQSLLDRLKDVGIVTKVIEQGSTGYRLKSSAMLLRAGDAETGAVDPIRRTFDPDRRPRVVAFFRDLYLDTGHFLAGLRAAEHTAQVRPEDREEREQAFRTAALPLLFCSPTMELGVDIASLNAVALRNVPPTPANYAQRSGRAGRSGQQALVVTYCASGNAHDSYYFQRSEQMVAGAVTPPRLDLGNEDLLRSHVHAMWLSEALALTSSGLHSSMASVVDLGVEGYPLRSELHEALTDPRAAHRALASARSVFGHIDDDLLATAWWTSRWLEDVLAAAPQAFDCACDRWRDLHRIADSERRIAERQAGDHAASKAERQDADRRRAEARQRIELLLNSGDGHGQSDFYTYRYLASEGFLPGYSFPRLPLAAYIPGSRRGHGDGTWLQRPRFLAVSEFGPNSLIYHEGARYQVSRIALPRSGRGDSVDVVRSTLRVCTSCGHHHEAQAGLDVCTSCGARLDEEWRELLQLQTVLTRLRQRISADEEERNRIGYELRTTYRFIPHGSSPGYLRSCVWTVAGTPMAEVVYGDSAEIRVTNLGRRNRKNPNIRGFSLDLVKGRWLSDSEGEDDAGDELEASRQDVRTQARVIPYVQDRRNIVVLRWAEPLCEPSAVTLQFALERGMEVHFQLEDSELTSQQLPDPENRGRALFVESAEGGAGVLRRIRSEPEALAQVARAALGILHIDPDTGEQDDDACVRGCYRCLLSYGNQNQHELIDRAW